MGVENFQYDGTTLPSTADNVEADGAILSEIQADGTVYWQRDTGGGGLAVVLPSSFGVVSLALSPDNALATIKFNTDGTITTTYQSPSGLVTDNFVANWVNDPNDVGFNPANYEIRVVVNSGDVPTGSTTGSFIGLGSTRSWTLQETVAGQSKINDLTITVREIADPTGNIDTSSATMNASKEN